MSFSFAQVPVCYYFIFQIVFFYVCIDSILYSYLVYLENKHKKSRAAIIFLVSWKDLKWIFVSLN